MCKEYIERGDEGSSLKWINPVCTYLGYARVYSPLQCGKLGIIPVQTVLDQNHVDVGCIKELAHLLQMAEIVRDTKEGKTSTRAADAGVVGLVELTGKRGGV